ncbi:MAG: RlmE family RNA methyltransferase [Tepidiphilus sp.]|jgi:23S rRNA (uridine2552-2'-O)-methyltransferase|uniref:Ribosomal RNA large subunit methyltransferase E n=1 Tax=Tepidiphilus thermophilus TaxID=876478 RepID=A0A0K6IXP2_9PROT|nr:MULTISPECIES: RlmE family RNA methyltransferase [Tepidiphilus]MBP6999600.1 RlmE family RNA methyltransferase [Tepidiphilus sp.]CUB07896.1 23S rRNA U2552 (ribose-2'-O)-methylase RlmE/FtsJ [Tepidiphilus thermophilus]
MGKNKSHRDWIHRHLNDPYVQEATRAGYRSRAAFKLLEIDDKDRLLRRGQCVLDLGSAPGAWSQVARERVGETGRVFALDLLPMAPIPGVDFLQGDFTEEATERALEALLAGAVLDVVLSDMAPNLSGIASVDQARAMHLAELALDFAVRHLRPEGVFLIKVFQGEGFDDFRRALGAAFRSVAVRKPKASRDRSAEVYLLGRGLRGA